MVKNSGSWFQRIGTIEPNVAGALIVIGIALLCLMLMNEIAPHRQPVPGTDSGIFLYVGDQLLDGKILYKDAWDHKGPLIFYINALGLLLRRDSLWGVWLLQLIAVGAAAFIGYKLMREAFGFGPSVFGSVVWLLGLRTVLDGGNLTEEYALPFQFAALWFFWQSARHKDLRNEFMVGFFSGIAFWLRANIIGVSIALGLYLLWEVLVQKDKHALRRLLAVLAGGVSLSLPILTFFVFQHNLSGLLDASFLYNLVYSTSTIAEKWASIIVGLSYISIAPLFGLAGWLLCATRLFEYQHWRSEPRFSFSVVLILLFPIELILVSLSGRSFPHYFMSLLPVYGLLSGFFLYYIFSAIQYVLANQNVRRRFYFAITTSLLISVAIIPMLRLAPTMIRTVQEVVQAGGVPPVVIRSSRTKRVLKYLSENLAPEEPLVIWGKDLSFNWLTGRRNPSQHIFQDHFFTVGYATPEMIDGYIEDLYEAHPVIIDTTVDRDFFPSIGTRLENLPEVVQPLYSFVWSNYKFVGFIEGTGWPVYRFAAGNQTTD